MSLAFRLKSSCPVPSNAAIDGSLVSSCEVSLAPDPICEFPIFDPVPVVPPGFTFGCYQPTIKEAIYKTPIGNGIKEFKAAITFPNKSDTGFCEPEFEFSVQFPCYKITKEVHVEGVMFFADAASSESSTPIAAASLFNVSIEYSGSDSTGFCEPHFDFKIRFPCTRIKIRPRKVVFVQPTEPLWMSIERRVNRATCDQEFRIFMNIPCASFTDTNASVHFNTDFSAKATMSWLLVMEGGSDSDACTYDSFFTLLLPCANTSSFLVVCSASLTSVGGISGGATTYSLTLWRRSLSFSCGYLIGIGTCAQDS